jgi:hypothetical protein
MPPRETAVPIVALRDAAQRHVAASSLRSVAREIGISHQALHAFLHGSEPYGKNLRKLIEWWHRGDEAELSRLREEVDHLKRQLAECQAKLGKR